MAYLLRGALVAALLSAVCAKVVFEEYFDLHPVLKYNKLEFEFFGTPSSFNVDVVRCPGDRDGVSDDWVRCLFMDLERCENPNWPEKGGCFRNEIGLRDERNIFDYENPYFVGFSLYMPEDYEVDSLKTLHMQIKANGGAFFSPGGPSFSLYDQYGYWGIGMRGSDDCKETCAISNGIMEYIAPVEPGKWVDFVWETHLSYDAKNAGYGRLWMNGIKVYEKLDFITTYKDPDDLGVFIKWGVYKHQWGEGDQGEFETKYSSMYINAFRVSRGKGTFLEADTSPRCYSFKTCCSTCINGKENILYNADRCEEEYCSKGKNKHADLCSKQGSARCGNNGQCCDKCVNGDHNPAYDRKKCFDSCRTLEHQGLAESKNFKKNCFKMGFNGCATNHLQCTAYGSFCQQQDYTFGCRCPPGFNLSNKNGRECAPVKKAKWKNGRPPKNLE